MRRFIVTSGLMVVWSAVAWAQVVPARPAPKSSKPAGPQPPTLQQKLRYICKQLDLDEKQRKHAEGLFAVLETEENATPEDLRARLDEIQTVYQEMTAAREAGKTELAEELRQKLRNLSPAVQAENNFVAGLLPALKEQQKEKFTKLHKELEDVVDLSLKPMQVVEVVRKFKLNADQEKKLADLQTALRKEINGVPDDEARRKAVLDKFIADIAALLEPGPRAAFEKEIDKLRPDEPPKAEKPQTSAPAATQPTHP